MEVNERVLRRGTKTYRPACAHLGLSAYSYSRHLQRLMVDFAAEGSFDSSSKRLKLHHRIVVSTSVIRKITLRHGQAMREAQEVEGVHGSLRAKGAERIITEIDGSMVPIVECSSDKSGDRRKKRDCHWREARLCAARVHGENSTVYGVNFGSVEQAGYTWAATVAQLPWATSTQLHALGDGASWIAKQCEQCLGADYLVDFYHVCEYLAAAASKAATHPRWMQVQKNRLKNNQVDKVIETLKPFLEEESIPEEDAPVRTALRYLENRIDQLDYKSAIENELPIGSGMIESGHRHVLQQRLKKAGAWWTHDNAQRMAALRVLRANQADEEYWKSAA